MAELAEGNLHERFMRESGLAAEIVALAEPVIEELGLRLVRVKISAQSGTTVQIMADRPDGAISVDDCASISRRVSPLLDAHDPIPGGYTLEVSSPGIDRPLFTVAQFARFIGEQAKISLRLPQDGRRRLLGRIVSAEGGKVVIAEDKGEFTIAHDNIEKARLVPDLVALGLAAEPKKPGGQRGKRRKPDASGKPDASDELASSGKTKTSDKG